MLSMVFSDIQNLNQETKFSYLFLFRSYQRLNNKIDAVSWADHNFVAIPSIKILSVDSNSTALKTP